jgi:hypothetical protein
MRFEICLGSGREDHRLAWILVLIDPIDSENSWALWSSRSAPLLRARNKCYALIGTYIEDGAIVFLPPP